MLNVVVEVQCSEVTVPVDPVQCIDTEGDFLVSCCEAVGDVCAGENKYFDDGGWYSIKQSAYRKNGIIHRPRGKVSGVYTGGGGHGGGGPICDTSCGGNQQSKKNVLEALVSLREISIHLP